MKQKILILLFITNFSYSQYKILYDYVNESFDSYGTSKTISKCYLYTDNIQSKFIKDRVINGELEQEFDYPKEDLEKKIKELHKQDVFGDSIGYVVTKFLLKDSIYTRTVVNALFKERSEHKEYKIIEEYKTILNFTCQKAITEIYGREFTVWFTTEIPVNDGPWKLYGLPGLILEAHSADKFHNFYATSIKKINNTSFIYKPVPYEILADREKSWKEAFETSEKNFKYRKSKRPEAKLKVTINSLDMPLIVFE
ncbi:GLPGLI family protein [Flavobacterium sp. TP390]|uniref:GLPGLI family protein n=1 Tax=Flavobacterium profundi TaxID=1774945 RepID=A0A6I4IT54_9FLAO|nr:GLPGLI family protein [Flavobacterium profundi]MVO10049.1 GLPGLI family protein [Flavobacterium profundi]